MHREHHPALGYASCALASGLWGTGFFFGKIALADMGFAYMVLYRFLFAFVALLPLLILYRPHFTAGEWRTLALAALLGVPMQFLLQFRGLSLTTVSHAALMVGTMPVLLAVGATVFAGEHLDLLGWAALAASTIGASLIALSGRSHTASGGASLTGDLLIVFSLIIALFWVLSNQRLVLRHHPVTVTAWCLALGTGMLAVWVPLRYGAPPFASVSLRSWGALAASGLLCTVSSTLLWNWGLTVVPASRAGVLLNTEPLVGSLLGVFALGEHLGPSAWVGGALILAAAVSLTTRNPRGGRASSSSLTLPEPV